MNITKIRHLLLYINHLQVPFVTLIYPLLRVVVLLLLPYTKNTDYFAFLPLKADTYYDFIVVGSGSSGGTAGVRLAEVGSWKILILEAGGIPGPETTVPGLHLLYYVSEQDWHYKTTPQAFSMFGYEDNRNQYPRGRVLGGCSTINYLMYVRGNRRDFDGWRDMGNEGWGYDDVLPFFKKSEDYRAPLTPSTAPFHSTGGPLGVERKSFSPPVTWAFLAAGAELGFRSGIDPNAENQTGFTIPDLTTRNGIRSSIAEAFLKPNIHKPNLDVLVKATVVQILFDNNKRAIGVVYKHKEKYKVAFARKEVILSAGAVESPKLLMLSGVGPRSHLESFQIPVIADVPGVGQNFHDQPVIFGLTWSVDKGTAFTLHTSFFNLTAYKDYKYNGAGPFSVPLAVESNVWAQVSGGDVNYPDLQILMISLSPSFDFGLVFEDVIGYKRELFEEYFVDLFKLETISMGPTVIRPKSRGSITLRSTDPFDMPNIDPNFLSDEEDADLFVRAIKFCIEIGNTEAMKSIGAKFYDKPLPGCRHLSFGSDDYWKCYARHLASTIYHSAGSCKMAPESDPLGVVDNKLRVRGVKGLRVADASIMPLVTSGNTNAPSIMIGERVADFIKEEYL